MKKKFIFLMTLFALNKAEAQVPNISMLKDINISGSGSPTECTLLNNKMYFAADDGNTGGELWVTDGTVAGTQLVKDIYPGSTGSYPIYFITCNGKLFFNADDGVHGRELWVSDGTSAGTQLLKDIKAGYNDSYPANFAVYNNKVIFQADDSVHAIEPWVTDGTLAGTQLLADINQNPSYQNSFPKFFTVYNNQVYFSADDFTHATELWVTDGTPVGTHLFKDINTTGYSASDPMNFTVYNNKLYFRCDPAASNIDAGQLWVTDGTVAGTQVVKNINPGHDGIIENMLVLNNKLFFVANNVSSGREVWTSDGTAAGTVLLKDINPGTASSYPYSLTIYKNKFYFPADDGTNGVELWASDGTTAGTVLLKDLNPGSADGDPDHFLAFGSKLYFIGSNSNNGVQLWTSDGTTTGTQQLLPAITPTANFNALSGCFAGFTAFNTNVYFSAEYDSHQCELWRLDTTATTGIKQFNINTIQANVYPNPGKDIFNLQIENYENAIVEVYNTIGQKALTQTIQNNITSLNLSDFKSGMYVLRILQNNLPVYQTKLLKQ